MTLRCEVFPASHLQSLTPEWDQLAARYERAPFMGSDFVKAAHVHFGQGDESLLRVSDDAGVAALALFVRRHGLWDTFQAAQSPMGCLVVREGLRLDDLMAQIGRSAQGPKLGVGVTQQDPACDPRPAHSKHLSSLDYITTASLAITGTFDDYWAQRGKNLRENMRKQRNKLAKEGITTTLEVLTSPEDVAEGVASYAALESAGWKGAEGTAVTVDGSQGRFYVDMLQAYCRRGKGKICRYRFGDAVVAVDLCIESDTALVVLKTTYDETIRTFSPAALMREELFRQWWQAGQLERIEFYGPVKDWHTRWSEEQRTMYHLNWRRWPAFSRAASKLVKRWRARTAKAEETAAVAD